MRRALPSLIGAVLIAAGALCVQPAAAQVWRDQLGYDSYDRDGWYRHTWADPYYDRYGGGGAYTECGCWDRGYGYSRYYGAGYGGYGYGYGYDRYGYGEGWRRRYGWEYGHDGGPAALGYDYGGDHGGWTTDRRSPNCTTWDAYRQRWVTAWRC